MSDSFWKTIVGFSFNVGALNFPLPIIFLWLAFLAALVTGKVPGGPVGRIGGRIYSRQETPVRYWIASLFFGFLAGWVTFLWNVVFKEPVH